MSYKIQMENLPFSNQGLYWCGLSNCNGCLVVDFLFLPGIGGRSVTGTSVTFNPLNVLVTVQTVRIPAPMVRKHPSKSAEISKSGSKVSLTLKIVSLRQHDIN